MTTTTTITVRNTNDAYGMPGPFEVESREALADEMEPTFRLWAEEHWDRLDERTESEHDAYIETDTERMRDEFIRGLKLV